MNDWVEYSAKSVDEAITNAVLAMKTTSDRIEYEVLEKESNGILGLFAKPAKIRVRLKKTVEGTARKFLEELFSAMKLHATFDISFDEAEKSVDVEIHGEEMGILIGKRGQTLDSLQYLTSLVINKDSEEYLKVKVDTENYRQRRKETLENLAKNIAAKVKRTRRPVTLEPMNSFERRIIHSALQNDKFVETHSEGEEPYRKVVVALNKDVKDTAEGRNYKGRTAGRSGTYYKKPYRKDNNRQGTYRKDYKSNYKTEDKPAAASEAANTAGQAEDNQ